MALQGGICGGLPLRIQDLMWGPDALPNRINQRTLSKTAVILCDMCPLRADCLALGIITTDQYGLAGGLGLKGRRKLRTRAVADGVRLDARDPRRELAQWIRMHPELVAEVRAEANARADRERRTADQAAWRARKRVSERRSDGDVPLFD